jgi:hypothetical protein
MEILKDVITNRKLILKKATTQQRKGLFHSPICIITALVLMGTLILVGCEDDDPTNVQCPQVQHVDNFRQPENSMGFLPSSERTQILPFTGRDSFGITLGAEVEGIIETVSAGGDSMLVEFSGTGQSALLGEIEVTHVHFVDLSSNEISEGRFTFKGESGELISGTYVGTRTSAGEGFTFNLQAKITGGEVECTPTALESGWGWIEGSLTDNSLDYQIDGWLFHHAEVEE